MVVGDDKKKWDEVSDFLFLFNSFLFEFYVDNVIINKQCGYHYSTLS